MRLKAGIHAGILSFSLFVAVLGNSIGTIAQAQELNTQVAEATDFFSKLASNSNNPWIASLAKENLSRLQQKSHPARQVVVPLMEQPDTSLVVPTMIEDKIMATFLVDTGSSYTVITPRMAKKLGIAITADTPRISLITANGAIKAPLVKLKNMAIGQVRVPEVNAVVQELGNGDDMLLSGLLGMNFFQGMDLTVKEDSLIIGIRDEGH